MVVKKPEKRRQCYLLIIYSGITLWLLKSFSYLFKYSSSFLIRSPVISPKLTDSPELFSSEKSLMLFCTYQTFNTFHFLLSSFRNVLRVGLNSNVTYINCFGHHCFYSNYQHLPYFFQFPEVSYRATKLFYVYVLT